MTYRDLGGDDGGGVLLHLESGEYHGVNRMGALIWGLIDGERSEEAIANELRRQLHEPPKAVEDDLRTFLAELQERNLIAE